MTKRTVMDRITPNMLGFDNIYADVKKLLDERKDVVDVCPRLKSVAYAAADPRLHNDDKRCIIMDFVSDLIDTAKTVDYWPKIATFVDYCVNGIKKNLALHPHNISRIDDELYFTP